jgi:Domain of unknown function (DUF5655)
MTEPRTWRGTVEWWVSLLERQTGAGVEEWNGRVRDTGIDQEPALRTWLTGQGVTGYPQMLLVMERFGYPDYLQADAAELLDKQYADRPALRPVLDRVLAVAGAVGEVRVQNRKTYVSLMAPRRRFAVIKATTLTRVDLGLRLDGQPAGGRLDVAKNLGNDSINVRIGLHSVDDVDDEVADWLGRAYAANA